MAIAKTRADLPKPTGAEVIKFMEQEAQWTLSRARLMQEQGLIPEAVVNRTLNMIATATAIITVAVQNGFYK